MNNTSEQETITHAVDPESIIVDTDRSRASNFSVSDAIKANRME